MELEKNHMSISVTKGLKPRIVEIMYLRPELTSYAAVVEYAVIKLWEQTKEGRKNE